MPDETDYKWLAEMYEKTMKAYQAENAKLQELTASLEVENAKLRELLDFALPIAMYAASTEEGDRMRELMREIGE